MIQYDEAEANAKYRSKMDGLMEQLAIAMFGNTGREYIDSELVEQASRKIKTLKKMILATGFNEVMLDAIMEE